MYMCMCVRVFVYVYLYMCMLCVCTLVEQWWVCPTIWQIVDHACQSQLLPTNRNGGPVTRSTKRASTISCTLWIGILGGGMHMTKHVALQSHAPASVHCAEFCISISISQERHVLMDGATLHFYWGLRWTRPWHEICTIRVLTLFQWLANATSINHNTFYFYLDLASCKLWKPLRRHNPWFLPTCFDPRAE